jgi:hypothetical protein
MKYILSLALLLISSTALSAQNRSGTYDRIGKVAGRGVIAGIGDGDITFRDIRRGKTKTLNFAIKVYGRTEAPCLGDLKGKAKWIDANTAEYNGDLESAKTPGCRITFIFSGKRVLIREHDCNDFHGASCDFEGTYRRRGH